MKKPPFPAPTRRIGHEMLDSPQSVAADIPDNLREIRRLNAWFGAERPLKSHLTRLLGKRFSASVVDVATGSADLPLALFRWGVERKIRLNIVASDVSPIILREAELCVGRFPIQLVETDARSLPWRNQSFDIAICSLALHHFDGVDAVRVLREMWRVCRVAVIVVDLYRSYLAYVGTWLATHVLCRNQLTRADGPLSVLRAYQPHELKLLAGAAGLRGIDTYIHPFFRQSLVALKGASYG